MSVEQISNFWKDRSTVKGLIVFYFFINPILIFFVSVAYYIFKNIKVIETTASFLIFIFSVIAFFILANLVILIIWIYWRRIPRISEQNIGVIFAPHSDPECSDLIYKLYEQFKLDISKRRLSNEITHKILPKNHVIKDHIDASNLLDKSNAKLIIHGHIQKGKINGDTTEGFRTISFTLRHRPLLTAERDAVLRDLASAMVHRAFTLKEKNSFIEKNIVIENISEVACFFIAVGLTLAGKVKESRDILEYLLTIVKGKMQSNHKTPQLRLFSNSIISCLTVTLRAQFKFIYDEYLIDHITQRDHDKYANQCMEILNKLVEIDKRTSGYYLTLAIIHFHYEDDKAAWDTVKKAKELSPPNSALSHFSFVFLSLWKGNYHNALKEYSRTKRCAVPNTDVIISIISFLHGILKNHPDKFQIFFGLAFVNDEFFDPQQAIKDYKSFLNKSRNNAQMLILKNYAKKRIKQLRLTIQKNRV